MKRKNFIRDCTLAIASCLLPKILQPCEFKVEKDINYWAERANEAFYKFQANINKWQNDLFDYGIAAWNEKGEYVDVTKL